VDYDDRKRLPFLNESDVTSSDVFDIVFKGYGASKIESHMPLTNNQSSMSAQLHYRDLLEKASEESNSLKRMAYVVAHMVTQSLIVKGQKIASFPTNGETFEMVTKDFKYVSEMLSC
jgi:hypothetical protein